MRLRQIQARRAQDEAVGELARTNFVEISPGST
jgi:hypothetical protein